MLRPRRPKYSWPAHAPTWHANPRATPPHGFLVAAAGETGSVSTDDPLAAALAAAGLGDVRPGETRPPEPRIEVVSDEPEEPDAPRELWPEGIGTGVGSLPGTDPREASALVTGETPDLPALPERLIVVGSGVTGAEFASGYQALGSAVSLVSSRDRVLPGEDADAAAVLEDVFKRRGMQVLGKSRAASVRRKEDGVIVTLSNDNIPAQYFYQRRGYRLTKVLSGAIAAHPRNTGLVGFADIPIEGNRTLWMGGQTSPNSHLDENLPVASFIHSRWCQERNSMI